MKRLLTVIPVGSAAALAVAAWTTQAADGGAQASRVLTVIEHATSDATADTGASGDSPGDVLTFANDVYDARDARKVGTDQGYCVRTVAGAAYECSITTLLRGGHIVVSGPFYDARSSTLAITGGTGRYRSARGTMTLRARAGGSKFAFAFDIR